MNSTEWMQWGLKGFAGFAKHFRKHVIEYPLHPKHRALVEEIIKHLQEGLDVIVEPRRVKPWEPPQLQNPDEMPWPSPSDSTSDAGGPSGPAG